MTVLAAVLTKYGAVLAADSRVTAGTTILTDKCQKIVRCGSAALAISGCDGNLLGAVASARNWEEVVRAAFGYQAQHDKLDWSGIGYDGTSLWHIDSDEHLIRGDSTAVAGCGGAIARGWLDGCRPARNLDEAKVLAVGACRAAIKRDSACGGRVRSIQIPAGRRH